MKLYTQKDESSIFSELFGENQHTYISDCFDNFQMKKALLFKSRTTYGAWFWLIQTSILKYLF